jgi:hypothetical protein
MSSSLPSTVTRMARVEHATPAHEPAFSHATARNSSDAPLRDLDIVAAFGRAFAYAGLTHEAAADLMKVDKAHWSRQLNNRDSQHISFQRLARHLPREFWLALLQELAPALGIVIAHPDLADRAIQQLVLATEAACAFARQDRALRAGGMR